MADSKTPAPDISFALSSTPSGRNLRRLLKSLCKVSDRLSIEVVIGIPSDTTPLSDATEPFRFPIRWFGVPRGGVATLRNRLFSEAKAPWVYFLDEDCELPHGWVDSFVGLLASAHPKQALGGFYLSPQGQSVVPRAYNSMANLWVKAHAIESQPLILAGNVLVPRIPAPAGSFPFIAGQAFGGEEIGFCDNLGRHGLAIRIDASLSVFHHCEHTWGKLFARAWLHGSSPFRPLPFKRACRALVDHLWTERSMRILSIVLFYVAVVRLGRICSLVLRKTHGLAPSSPDIHSHSGL